MNCPRCDGVALIGTEVRSTTVDRCRSCGGIWFDETELETLLEENAASLRPLRSSKSDDLRNRQTAACPRDGEVLVRVCSAKKHAVVLDTCPRCQGIWLDGGELERLLK